MIGRSEGGKRILDIRYLISDIRSDQRPFEAQGKPAIGDQEAVAGLVCDLRLAGKVGWRGAREKNVLRSLKPRVSR